MFNVSVQQRYQIYFKGSPISSLNFIPARFHEIHENETSTTKKRLMAPQIPCITSIFEISTIELTKSSWSHKFRPRGTIPLFSAWSILFFLNHSPSPWFSSYSVQSTSTLKFDRPFYLNRVQHIVLQYNTAHVDFFR